MHISPSDTYFMQRCLEQAMMGAGDVAPNPLVGAALVHNGTIIGEGFHKQFGAPHAEVNAIDAVKECDRHLIPFSTLYVNLEPCSHFGKTPPCADLVIRSGIKKVVIANHDSNPMVAGKGIEKLRAAGCEVKTGILEKEAAWLNRRFFTFHQKKRPYIILKWAQSADGFFTRDNRQQHWITGEQSKRLTHRWRSEEAAVMVGTNTALADNPQLTNRLWMKSGQPMRVILDRTLRLPQTLHIFDNTTRTIVFNEATSKTEGHIEYCKIPFSEKIAKTLVDKLYDMNIQSVIVEGGAQLLHTFISENLWDEARVLTGNILFGSGLPAPAVKGKESEETSVGSDKLKIIINR